MIFISSQASNAAAAVLDIGDRESSPALAALDMGAPTSDVALAALDMSDGVGPIVAGDLMDATLAGGLG